MLNNFYIFVYKLKIIMNMIGRKIYMVKMVPTNVDTIPGQTKNNIVMLLSGNLDGRKNIQNEIVHLWCQVAEGEKRRIQGDWLFENDGGKEFAD